MHNNNICIISELNQLLESVTMAHILRSKTQLINTRVLSTSQNTQQKTDNVITIGTFSGNMVKYGRVKNTKEQWKKQKVECRENDGNESVGHMFVLVHDTHHAVSCTRNARTTEQLLKHTRENSTGHLKVMFSTGQEVNTMLHWMP